MLRIFILLILFAPTAFAFELVMIQAISDSEKTFITRTGKREGIVEGYTATFTADDVSIIAKAKIVTGELTQWQVVNPKANIPFKKGALVTYYRADEYIWSLASEKLRGEFIKSQIPVMRKSWVLKGAITKGVSESTSEAVATTVTRGGVMFEAYYEKDFTKSLAWDLGTRYEREVINYPQATFITKRLMLIGDLIYYIDALKETIPGRVFLAIGAGYGLSGTESTGISQAGYIGLLPTARLGLNLPINEQYDFIVESAFESMQTIEEQQGGRRQSTTQTNFKAGIGLRIRK